MWGWIRGVLIAGLASAAVAGGWADLPIKLAQGGQHAARDAPAGQVIIDKVLDGDTVVVRGWKERVRLANIDAPEMSHGYRKPGQPFSVQATNWLSRKVEGKSVTARCVDEDRYGRSVCDLYLDGEHVNRELVRSGLAWANTANPRYLRDKSILQVQHEAEAQHRGLWTQPSPVPPWQWRRDCWQDGTCPVASRK